MSRWLEFKLSQEIYQKGPEALADGQKQHLARTVVRQTRIEESILSSPEAAGVVVPFSTLDARLAEIRGCYGSGAEYRADLARLGMTEADLSREVNRDLLVESVLEKVTASVPQVSEVDAEIYFRLHPGAFERGESRRLRHILLTFDDGAGKSSARALLEGLRQTIRSAEDFGQAALRHSQCPTALQQGEMGVVKPGQLYAELESAAFALPTGEVSAVQESPMGLHLLWCDECLPAKKLEFGDVRDRLLEKLNEKRRAVAQRHWLESLLAARKGA